MSKKKVSIYVIILIICLIIALLLVPYYPNPDWDIETTSVGLIRLPEGEKTALQRGRISPLSNRGVHA